MGCCLFASMLAGAPRLAFLLMWIFWPVRTQGAYSSFWIALLGVIFVPWTTVMYVFVAPGGLSGFDWVWMGLAVAVDIATYTGGGYGNKRRTA